MYTHVEVGGLTLQFQQGRSCLLLLASLLFSSYYKNIYTVSNCVMAVGYKRGRPTKKTYDSSRQGKKKTEEGKVIIAPSVLFLLLLLTVITAGYIYTERETTGQVVASSLCSVYNKTQHGANNTTTPSSCPFTTVVVYTLALLSRTAVEAMTLFAASSSSSSL
jgi:hypothetical protein